MLEEELFRFSGDLTELLEEEDSRHGLADEATVTPPFEEGEGVKGRSPRAAEEEGGKSGILAPPPQPLGLNSSIGPSEYPAESLGW